MLGESDANWAATVSTRTIEMEPDSVTIYQMELPYNTTISSDVLQGTAVGSTETVAPWATKRRWVQEAFRRRWKQPATRSGAPIPPSRIRARTKFVYRDRLWQGADLVGTGSRLLRPHQRRAPPEHRLVGPLCGGTVEAGSASSSAGPTVPPRTNVSHSRVRPSAQAGLGSPRRTFRGSTGWMCASRFESAAGARFGHDGYLDFRETGGADYAVTRDALLRVDSLLPRFFLEEHTAASAIRDAARRCGWRPAGAGKHQRRAGGQHGHPASGPPCRLGSESTIWPRPRHAPGGPTEAAERPLPEARPGDLGACSTRSTTSTPAPGSRCQRRQWSSRNGFRCPIGRCSFTTSDMTVTLEQHFGDRVTLRPLVHLHEPDARIFGGCSSPRSIPADRWRWAPFACDSMRSVSASSDSRHSAQ